MQLKNIFIAILLFAGTAGAQNSRNRDLILPGNAVYGEIHDSVIKSFLSLDSSTFVQANENGIVFVKFNVINGKVENIAFLKYGLQFIKSATEKALKNIDANKLAGFNQKENENYILPIVYRFEINGGKDFGKTAAQLLAETPTLSAVMEKVPVRAVDDFQQFMDINENRTSGVKCYMLMPLEISRPMI